MNPHAYITSTGAFLPGEPVTNDHVEDYLGKIFGKPCPLRTRVLKNNGIITRHYAIDTQQKTLFQNEDMAANAVLACLGARPLASSKLSFLAMASTQGDLAIPGLASMVHGHPSLDLPPCEILSTHGVCASGIMALKAAVNTIRLGEHDNAVVCASELSSRQLKASRYEASRSIDDDSRTDMDSAFLRWMLSDGAGAVLLQNQPNPNGLSLRVDWIRVTSYAHSLPVCMYAGRSTRPNAPPSWMDYPCYADAERDAGMLLRQDIRLLDNIVKLGVMGFLQLVREDVVDVKAIDHFLCHYSSHYFRGPIVELLSMGDALIPEERWFTNLYTKGNTGCAAIFIMLDEFFRSGKLKAGDTVFCFVPESGRFTTTYMQLTAV